MNIQLSHELAPYNDIQLYASLDYIQFNTIILHESEISIEELTPTLTLYIESHTCIDAITCTDYLVRVRTRRAPTLLLKKTHAQATISWSVEIRSISNTWDRHDPFS